jgi:hypothetical protein
MFTGFRIYISSFLSRVYLCASVVNNCILLLLRILVVIAAG